MLQRLLSASFLAFGLVAFAHAAPDLKPVQSVEGITEYRLPNGLQVLLAPDDSKPTATVNLTYLVGSRHEGRGETGAAHAGTAPPGWTAPTTSPPSPAMPKRWSG